MFPEGPIRSTCLRYPDLDPYLPNQTHAITAPNEYVSAFDLSDDFYLITAKYHYTTIRGERVSRVAHIEVRIRGELVQLERIDFRNPD